ncbi:MAG TPA: hypothetical protein VNL18_13615 [Gemmatimonadales bacterium]|nr:hypothetical protein [Gemmatimonadales bacterium]
MVLVRTLAAPSESLEVRLAPTRYELTVRIDYDRERLEGTARLTLRNASDDPVTEIPLLLYRLMEITAAAVNGSPARWTQSVVRFADFPKLQVLHARVSLAAPVAPGATVDLDVGFGGHLLGYAETGMAYVKDRLSPAFTILRDDAFAFPLVGVPLFAAMRARPFPSYDYLARITVPDSLVVVNAGRLVDRTAANGAATFVFHSVKPSWRMDFAIGDYAVIQQGPLRVAYLRRDSVGAARVARAARQSLDLLTTWFGPLVGEPSLTILELEDGHGSQTDVAAILQTAAAFRDSTRDHELYHEVAHLWNAPATDLPSPRWNEGLSTFLEYLVVEEFSGRPVVRARADQLLDWLRGMAARRPQLGSVPLVNYGKEQMTDFSYSVGAVFFHLLYDLAGPDRFRTIVGDFYRQFGSTGGSTSDFVALATRAAGTDVCKLFDEWFYSTSWLDTIRTGVTYAQLVDRYRSR